MCEARQCGDIICHAGDFSFNNWAGVKLAYCSYPWKDSEKEFLWRWSQCRMYVSNFVPLVPRNPCFSTGHLIIKGYYKVISEVRKDCILLFPKFLLLIQLKWNLFEAAHLQPFICQHNLFLAIMMSRWRGFCRDKSRKPRMNGRVEEESNQNRRLKFFFCLDHKSKSVLFKNAKVDLN